MRYYFDKTQSEIAKELGVSQVQISRIENKILGDMKEKLSKEDYEAMMRKETILVDATKMSLDDLRLKYSKEEVDYLLKVTENYKSPEHNIPDKFKNIKIEE